MELPSPQMPAKKTSKAEFLRSIPASMPLEEVIASARKAGVDVSLREVTARRTPEVAKRKSRQPAPVQARARRPRGELSNDDVEKKLAELVLEHGARQVEAALQAIRARIRSI